ncbi:hypothetical protein [Planomonospora venezuelensis]|uniref:Uncharacterized protein n=1 Tax=Planomonospora venezuelensis TaxID=1999 RepID=A0A841DM94_PLAVE|nr:hypothetical protein [Planomonospora venezuelensis]MBB5968216.1 hypothetical protein [Planomonospora venezuelensis]GIN05817.1 hypothetical protein Pve01_74750 [Planomonospora venezuelensis]
MDITHEAPDQMITTSLRLPRPVMEAVRARAAERGIKPTALIREAIVVSLADTQAMVPMSVLLAAAEEYAKRQPIT